MIALFDTTGPTSLIIHGKHYTRFQKRIPRDMLILVSEAPMLKETLGADQLMLKRRR
jgi:hypothetical protein